LQHLSTDRGRLAASTTRGGSVRSRFSQESVSIEALEWMPAAVRNPASVARRRRRRGR
jgi:hypothetical protein